MYIVIFSLKIKPLQYERRGDFVVKQYIIFSIFSCLVMCLTNIKHYGHQKIISYILLCRLILSNPFHLTIGLKLNLIHNEF